MFARRRWAGLHRGLAGLCLALAPQLALAVETSLTAPGLSEEVTDQLRGASSALAAENRGLTTPQELLAAARSDYRSFLQVLYDAGYFSPVVTIKVDGREAADIDPLSVPARVNRIDITVKSGSLYRLGRAEVAPLAPGTELPEGFASGQPASTGLVRAAAIAGVDGWRRVGHAKAEVGAQRIVATEPPAVLDAEITLLPGRELRFGQMRVTGARDVREEAIRKIAGFPSGEVFSPEQVGRVGTRLRRTGAFTSVAVIEDETPNPDGTLDFTVEVEEQLPRRITFGGEISSREGLDLSAVWIHRNLFGNAERLRLEAGIENIGGDQDIGGTLSFRLDRPATLGPDDNTFYLGALETLNETHYTLRRAALGFGARRVFSDELYAEIALVASVARSDDAFGDDREFNQLTLPFKAVLDKRDNPINATKGYFVDARLAPFTGFSGSASGLWTLFDGRGYLSLAGSSSIVLAGRLQIGSVLGAPQDETSPDLLFFSGGAGTVRGQPYQSLGVPVAGGIAGGRSLIAASAEVRGRVTEKISLVGFYDYGVVGADSFVDSSSPTQAGAGLGVRYDLGTFGPLRLDLAYPVEGDTGDGLQFYIGIGQAF